MPRTFSALHNINLSYERRGVVVLLNGRFVWERVNLAFNGPITTLCCWWYGVFLVHRVL